MRTLRFACQQGCIRCCDVKGFVYLSETDVKRAAEFLKLDQAEFEQRYVIRFRHVIRLRKPLDSQCHFLTEGGCSIHPVKPTQCRLYPYWPELVETAKAWNEAGKFCPGIGKGDLVQIGTACEVASEMKTAYPHMYPEFKRA